MSQVQYFVCNACEFRFGPIGVKPHQPDAERQQLFALCNKCRNPMAIDDIPGQITTPCSVCGECDFSALNQCPVCASSDVRWRGQDELNLVAATHTQTAGEQEHINTTPPGGPESISIQYRKLSGCLSLILGVMSLGVANLAIWLTSRKWPVLADESGVVLGNGKRIAWERIQRVVHVTTNVSGTVVHRFTFELDRGSWMLPYERLVNPQPVLDFVMARVPASAKQSDE